MWNIKHKPDLEFSIARSIGNWSRDANWKMWWFCERFIYNKKTWHTQHSSTLFSVQSRMMTILDIRVVVILRWKLNWKTRKKYLCYKIVRLLHIICAFLSFEVGNAYIIHLSIRCLIKRHFESSYLKNCSVLSLHWPNYM